MAENTTVNKVVINNETVIDITDTTATPGTVASGQVFYKASGERAVGSMTETDPIFTASPAYGIASSDITNWDSKVGEDVSGQTFTVDETEVTAGDGAERFNDYTNNIATGNYSHAEGYQTKATGTRSHAEGNATTASGTNSHAEGTHTVASALNTHAEGTYTTAVTMGAHAEGGYTIARGMYQHVQGKYNIEDASSVYAHIVGNGTNSVRANIHTLDWNGAAWYKGGVKVGGTSAADATELTPGIQKFTITVTRDYSVNPPTYTANKTFAEIVAAYNNGDILEVIISDTESILTLSNADTGEYGVFTFRNTAIGDDWAGSEEIYITYEDNVSYYNASFTETDPTVPSWAKASSKPTYTASEVGALPSTTVIPSKTSDLTNDSGFLTSYTETDPTVPSWAKQPTKPTYTALEVGALPSSTAIPSKTSDLTNDSGFITSSDIPVTSVNGETGAVEISKGDLGLGNVENKSSSTIRSELTQSNVTTALGYTPYTPAEVDALVSAVFHYKGTKATYAEVAALTGMKVGDVWQVTADNSEYVYNGSAWEKLGPTIDLSGYLTSVSVAGQTLTPSSNTITVAQLKTALGLGSAAYVNTESTLTNGSNLPTGAAVKSFVEGKGYTTNTGTITGVSVNGTSIATSGVANIPVPTKVSDLTNDSGYITSYTESDPTVPSWAKQSTKPTYTASEVGALPSTTVIPSKTSDLTNDSGFLTSYTETDPTVPSWAKQSTKPTYTASEVGALPDTTEIPTKTSDLTNDSGFLTSYTETDPTVPSWAKQPTKPTYTASEVGALPSTTVIPSKTSDLTNDSGFLTSYTETDPTVPSWAKQSTKPTYTASEVGALPSTTAIPSKTSDLTNDSGFITSYTETDPTVPSWAKQSTKPTYTASEVGALPDTTTYVSSVNGSTGAVVIGTATTSADGLMSSTDKTHLDAVYADYSSALTALGV